MIKEYLFKWESPDIKIKHRNKYFIGYLDGGFKRGDVIMNLNGHKLKVITENKFLIFLWKQFFNK